MIALRLKLSNFFDWIFSNRPLPNLVELLQNGERASRFLSQLNTENEQLKYRTRETNKQLKYLSTDYCNLISKLLIIHLFAFLPRLSRHHHGIGGYLTTSCRWKNDYQ